MSNMNNSKSCLSGKEELNFYIGECLEVIVIGTYAFDEICDCDDDFQTCISENICETCLTRYL